MVQPEGEPGDSDGHGAENVDCVPLANEKQEFLRQPMRGEHLPLCGPTRKRTGYCDCHALLQGLLKMKLSSGKVQAWE